jgi:peptidoglycan/xylan/chitin deacetylase (PgdA/CDA1 family)
MTTALMKVYVLACLLQALIFCANPPASKCFNDGEVALTYEGGPDVEKTPLILNALKLYNATATFFLRAASLDGWPSISIAKRIVSEGHIIGLLLEPTMEQDPALSIDTLASSISNHVDIIEKTVGKRPKFLRASYSNTTIKFGDFLNSNGYICTVPSIDTMDYLPGQSPLKHIIVEMPRLPAPIIRLHDTSSVTANMAKDVINYIKMTAGRRLVDIVNCTGMAFAYAKEEELKVDGNVADRPLDIDGGLFAPKKPEEESPDSGKFGVQIAGSSGSRTTLNLFNIAFLALLSALALVY